MSDFIEVMKSTALNDGEMTAVLLEGHDLLVAKVDGEFYIADGRCPHLHGHMVKGTLEGTVLTCPLHGSQFDLTDGSVVRWTKWEGAVLGVAKLVRHPRSLRTYEVKVEDGTVYVGPQKATTA